MIRKVHVALASLVGLLGASAAQADSYIFVTNTTPNTVSVSIDHYGDRTLDEGDEWAQEATQILPYETKRVLRFNRYWGVKRNKKYYFDTNISDGQSTVKLRQQMKGTWSGSNIKHGASGADFNSPWYSDRDIHNFNTNYSSRDSVNSFRAEFTGGYDDFHYTIHNNTEQEAVAGSDGLKVLAYNIWALPAIASNIGDRLDILPDHLKGYDAILLQEVFDSGRTDFLNAMSAEYPYQTEILDAPGFNIHDGGVLIVSRWPIVEETHFPYPDCTGTDCFAEKGVVYAQIIKQGQAYHLTSTHTASFDTAAARDLRQEQFQQIRALIDGKNIPATDGVLMGGDFNVNKLKFPGDHASMLANLNATEPTNTGYTKATFDPEVNSNAGNSLSGGETVEYLDYVVYSNTHKIPQSSTNEVKVLRSIDSDIWGVWDLSDHFPVLGDFEY